MGRGWINELKLRGLIERVLVVCPANLSFQWQRELAEKFDEKFLVLKGSDIRDQFGVNQWMEQKQIITSLDLAKRSEILPGLMQARGARDHRAFYGGIGTDTPQPCICGGRGDHQLPGGSIDLRREIDVWGM